ncbi:transient receptor potential cation channel subfamily M member 6-like isoform X2 [Liolophura sinensis]|uniref:transient receptor potential cation channel subfamily M member 6-like isoform X2 n=1 Tax=Liolophura sinensis TaxID=3198878 RepID=UPI003158D734
MVRWFARQGHFDLVRSLDNKHRKVPWETDVKSHNFRQKECSRFVPQPEQRDNVKIKDVRCFCGEVLSEHAGFKAGNVDYDAVIRQLVPEELQKEFSKSKWDHKASALTLANNTVPWEETFESKETNACGKVYFTSIGDTKPAKFIRVSDEDKVEDVWNFLKTTWRLMSPAPDLIISVVGGAKNFRLEGLARDKFKNGLLKIAETTQPMFITSGFNVGVMKAIGQIIKQGQSYSIKDNKAVHNIRCLAIAPWGFVKNRRCLEKRTFEATYANCKGLPGSFEPLPLNPYHTHFVLVDNGYRNRFTQTGNIAEYRAELEMEMNKESHVVLVVVEGGTGVLSDILCSLNRDIPVVICNGTGRASNLMAYAISRCDERGQLSEHHHDKVKRWLMNLYGNTWSDEKERNVEVEKLKNTVCSCLEQKDKIKVFDINEDQGLDFYVLSALFHQKSDNSRDNGTLDRNGRRELQRREKRLDLAISLNRPDLAEVELFTESDYWPSDILYKKLETCIIEDLGGFVRLLIQQEDVDMETFLTYQRLERIYHESITKDTLLYKLVGRKTKRDRPVEEVTLQDIGKVIRGLLDTYDKTVYGTKEFIPTTPVKDPYLQLFIWAVLNERKILAKLFWEFVDTPVATALLGSWLYFKMSNKLGAGDQEWAADLLQEKETMEKLAVHTLSELHARYPKQAFHCLERDKPLWGNITSLQIASAADAKLFLGSPTCQKSLRSEWLGDVKMQLWQIFLCLPLAVVLPFLVGVWGRFKEPTKRKSWTKKIAEFFCSPRVKFINYVVSYIIFLVLFTYLILFEVNEKVCVLEWICAVWAFSILLDECHRIICVPVLSKRSLFRLWRGGLYWFYLLSVLMVLVGVFIHAFTTKIQLARNIFAVNCVFFYLRILRFYTASEHLGPKLHIIKSTLRPLFFFGLITLVFLFAYGVPSQALMYEKRRPYWGVLYDIVYVPYWQIYGELQLENIETDEDCLSAQRAHNISDPSSCRQFSRMVPLMLAIYLFFANVLLLNLIIAIFTKIFETVESNSIIIWKYQMYFFIKEYRVKSILPTPISLLEDTFRIAKHLFHCCCRMCITQPKELRTEEEMHLRWVERQVTDRYIRKAKELEDLAKNKHLYAIQKSIDSLRSNLIGDLGILGRMPKVGVAGVMDSVQPTPKMARASDRWGSLLHNHYTLTKAKQLLAVEYRPDGGRMSAQDRDENSDDKDTVDGLAYSDAEFESDSC